MRAWLLGLGLFLAGCGGAGGGNDSSTTPAPPAAATPPGMAFFYQDVNNGANTVRAGFTADAKTIDAYRKDVAQWIVIGGATRVYGNPVLLPDAAAKTAYDACFGR